MTTYYLLGASNPTGVTTNASTGFSLGTEFGVTATCWITAIRYYKASPSDFGTPTGRLYTVTTATTGAAVSGTDVTFTGQGSTTAAGWKQVNLATPVKLTVGQKYRVAGYFTNGSNFSATNNYWSGAGTGASNIVNGPVTAYSKANATGSIQGSFVAQTTGTFPVYPTTLGSDANYWIDVVVTDVYPFGPADDTAGATDSVSYTNGYGQTPSDTAGATDSTSTAQGYGRPVTDTAGAADTTGQVANYAPSITDPAGAADTFIAGLGAVRTVTDTAGAADTVAQPATYSRALSDAIGVADTDDEAWDQHFPLSDTAGATDTASTAQAYAVTTSDAIDAGDAVFDSVGNENLIGISDETVDASDSVAQATTSSRSVSDTAGTSDSLQTAEAEHSAITDPAGASDSISWGGDAARTVTDTAGAHDSTTYVVGHLLTRTVTDTAGAHDTAPHPIVTATPPLPVTPAIETDTAFALGRSVASKPVVPAVDSQVARVIPPAQATKPATIATQETDSAFALRPTGSYPTGIAVDVERALPLDDAVVDSDAWAEAIESDDRVAVYTLRADWGRDGTFSHPLSNLTDVLDNVTVTRELAGELPAEVGLVEGYSAATMSFTISGQWPDLGVDPVQEFAPYRTDAMLYSQPTIGVPVELETGFQTREGRKTTRRFTGSTSRINPSSAARDVQIDCLDAANKLRAPITQGPVGLDASLLAKYGPTAYFARYNSQWLIDRILRANGVYASPPTQDDVFLSVTMHGSQVPEIGGGGVPEQYAFGSPNTTQAWTNTGHPFGMLYPHPMAPAPVGSWYADERLTMGANSGFGWSGWVLMPSSASDEFLWGIVLNAGQSSTAENYQVTVEIASGVPAMTVSTPTEGVQGAAPISGWVIPAQPTWTFIGCHWGFVAGGVNLTMNVNGRLYPDPAATPTPFAITVAGSVSWQPTTTVIYELDVPATNLSWWKEPIPPAAWTGQTWISQADIDPGLNELTGIPELVGEDSWSLLTEVVDAEYGVAQFSPEGRFSFRSRAVIRPRGTPERVTAQRELADMVTTTDEAGVRNSISAALTPLLVGPYEWIIASDDVGLFQAGPGTSYFDVTLPSGVVVADSPFIENFFSTDAWNQLVDTYPNTQYLCVAMTQFHSQTTLADYTNVDIRLFRKDAATLTIAIYNRTTDTIIFKTPDVVTANGDGTTSTTAGVPAFKLPGRKLVEQGSAPQIISDPGSIALYGPRTYELGGSGGSRWHQHPEATAGIAEGLLGATGHPVPVLDAVTVRHDPRRNLGDPITVADPYGLGEVTGTIVGITTTFADGSATTDALTVRPLAPPGFGLWDDPVLGRIGHTLRFGP